MCSSVRARARAHACCVRPKQRLLQPIRSLSLPCAREVVSAPCTCACLHACVCPAEARWFIPIRLVTVHVRVSVYPRLFSLTEVLELAPMYILTLPFRAGHDGGLMHQKRAGACARARRAALNMRHGMHARRQAGRQALTPDPYGYIVSMRVYAGVGERGPSALGRRRGRRRGAAEEREAARAEAATAEATAAAATVAGRAAAAAGRRRRRRRRRQRRRREGRWRGRR